MTRIHSRTILLGAIALLWQLHTSTAQPPPLTARLIISPVISSYVSDWERDPNQIRLSVVNITQNTFDVGFEVRVHGRRSGFTLRSVGRRLSIRPGPQVLFPRDIIDFEQYKVSKQVGSSMRISRRLPDDDWELCVTMTVVSTGQIVTTCAEFTLQFAVPPTLITPQNGEKVTTHFPLFQWNSASMKPGINIFYRMQICEIHTGQSSRQALESNPPHFKQEGIMITSLLYPVAGLPFKSKASYVWQVQAYDEYGNPLGDNEGKSEIWMFEFLEGK